MPITFPVENRAAEGFQATWRDVSSDSAKFILEGLPTAHQPARLLQSSVRGTKPVVIKKNGFVLGVVTAYNKHHNLIIRLAILYSLQVACWFLVSAFRPDDIWIAILSQLNF